MDRADTELLLRTRSQIREVLKGFQATSTNFGMIHADLDPANVLVQDGRVTLIDFDDAGYGWHLYELASDPGETRNLAAEMPEVLVRLKDAWSRYAEEVGVVPAEK